MLLSPAMRLAAGAKLGPYEVVSPLGAGGMGEVYRARDTRLGRDVAIKVLPPHLSENPEILARFEREARTISSLNHPHICTLYDVGREGDVEYLVMELIEGETLAQRLEKGPLPLADVLRFGQQMADALDRAHRAGVIHRDFKPGNVMITRAGVKLTDFGLARTAGAGEAGPGSGISIAHLSHSPTVASPLTAHGAIVGTFLYMAPEQLEGREADTRSDLWALGCVLYEMLTGRRAFEGKSQASLIGSIMGTEPAPITLLAPSAPPSLEGLVRACLAKDPEERIQTAHDVKLQLGWIAQGSSAGSVVAPALPVRKRFPRETVAWAVAAVAIAAAALFAWRGAGDRSGDGGMPIRFTIDVPKAIMTLSAPRLSPDGRMIAFAAQDTLNRTMIWVRPLNALEANPLPGTVGARMPFWSPDSRHLGFMAGGKLKRIPISGGPASVICDAPSGSDGSWSSRGVILYDGAGFDPILRVDAGGGTPAVEVSGDSTLQVGWPAFLPDGRRYLFTRLDEQGNAQFLVGTLGDTAVRAIGVSGSRVEYSADGHLLYVRDRTLLAQRFDARSGKTRGDAFPIAENLPAGGNASADFSVSDNGVIAYRALGELRSRLTWLDRAGREVQQVAAAADYRAPSLSPDGRRVAIRRTDGGNLDVWMLDLVRGTSGRFTFDPGFDGNPVWSPDGARLSWTGTEGASTGIMVKASSGLGSARVLAGTAHATAVLDWFHTSDRILYQAVNAATGGDLFVVDVAAGSPPQALVQTPFFEQRGRISPGDRWLAYESNETGRPEIYVVSLTGAPAKWQVSIDGGTDPCWSRDGRELFYLAGGQLMSVPVTADPDFHPGTPRPLFRVRAESGGRRNVFEVSPDGQRFLFLVPDEAAAAPLTVLVNWRARN